MISRYVVESFGGNRNVVKGVGETELDEEIEEDDGRDIEPDLLVCLAFI